MSRVRTPHPTPRQRDVIDAVRAMTAELGEAPSARQLALRLGIARPTLIRHLLELEDKGLLRDQPVTVRSGRWALTEQAERARPAPRR